MSEHTNKQDALDADEATTAKLLKLAGQRPEVPQDAERRVYARVHAEWQKATSLPEGQQLYKRVQNEWRDELAQRRRQRWYMPLALAASFALVVAVVLQSGPSPLVPQASVATVVRVLGNPSAGLVPAVGAEVFVGDQLATTDDSGLSIRLAGSGSLRLDENTTLVAQAGGRFELLQGRVYVDSGDLIYRDTKLAIETPYGTVTDIGTQFVVASGADALEVAVREGRVDLSGNMTSVTAVAGERLKVQASGEVATYAISSHDDYWAWATDLAPTFEIENRSLLDFLRWASRETGRELEFEDEELRMAAMRTDLHGSIEGIALFDAIETVVATTTFHYRIDPDRIVIAR